MFETICAVVITYNRRMLLLECLEAILTQIYPVKKILIINNASTDGTYEMLQTNGYLDRDMFECIILSSNLGGAGGFYEGLKRAYQQGFEWLWLMDDDSIPEPDALSQLFAAYNRFPSLQQPKLLASKVVWMDGSLHPMNSPLVKTGAPESLLLAAQHGAASIRCSTFVSLLLHRSLIEKYGLPIADYFIWADDMEYTARILRNEFGVVVPDSVVKHKTIQKYTRMDDAGPRYYYHVRNNLWIITRSTALSGHEKIKQLIRILVEIPQYLIQSRFRWSSCRAVGLGLAHGLLKSPKVKELNEE